MTIDNAQVEATVNSATGQGQDQEILEGMTVRVKDPSRFTAAFAKKITDRDALVLSVGGTTNNPQPGRAKVRFLKRNGRGVPFDETMRTKELVPVAAKLDATASAPPPPPTQGKAGDWKDGYSSGFEAAKALFAPENWASAKDNFERLSWLALVPGATLHEPVTMPSTISESKSWLISNAFGDELGTGATLLDAIDDGRKRFPEGTR